MTVPKVPAQHLLPDTSIIKASTFIAITECTTIYLFSLIYKIMVESELKLLIQNEIVIHAPLGGSGCIYYRCRVGR